MNERGFSILEIILAVALFMIFSTAAIVVVVGGFNANRQGIEYTIANQFAAEGIEAVRSIKNRGFACSINTSGSGVARDPLGYWIFSGTENTLSHNVGDNYVRVIKIEDVQRDGSGNIVSSGGTLDSDSKRVISEVRWNSSLPTPNSVKLISYISNWKKTLLSPSKGGILAYGNGGTTSDTISYRILETTGFTWTAQANAADVDTTTINKTVRALRVYSSPNRNEKVIVSRHSNGTNQYIYGQVFDGSVWSDVILLSSWSGNTFLNVRNFDGAYLSNGHFMVVYSDNTSTPKFRIWDGCSWSNTYSMQNLATNLTTTPPSFITLRSRPNTNEVMAAIFAQDKTTHTQYFNGSSYSTGNWTLHAKHANSAPTSDTELIDFVWNPSDPLRGALNYSNSSADKKMNLKSFVANGSGGGSWTNTSNSVLQGTVQTLNLAARTNAIEYVACAQDKSRDVVCSEGDNNGNWLTITNRFATTNTDIGLQRAFDINYQGVTGNRAIVVYAESPSQTTPRLKKYDPAINTLDTSATSLPVLNSDMKSVKLINSLDDDDIVIMMGDANNNLYSVFWDSASGAIYTSPSGKAFTSHGANGASSDSYWYEFAWDRY